MRQLLPSARLFLLALVFSAAPVPAQTTTGSLSGTVTDPGGATVVNANVVVKNNATGIERNATTDDKGSFVFASLEPGRYSVAVEAAGFKKAVAQDVVVETAVQAQVSIGLEVGSVGETVTVTAAQEVINASSSALTNVINTRQVQDLPLPGRNPLDLAGLQPGVAPVGTDVRGSSISGLPQQSTNVTQDGINAMDNFVKTSSLFARTAPSLNSIGEISITTGTNEASAGRGVAQVRLVTRGGTNEFHGDLFYLNRNDYFQANSFFNNLTGTQRPRQNQHFFGFSLGGPVILPYFGEGGPHVWNGRDRSFWFLSYEGFRENFSVTRNRTVLTQEARNGIFRYTGANGQTQSVNLLDGRASATAINPVTAAVLNAMPLPNNTLVGDSLNTAGFRYNVLGRDVNDKVVMRFDHELVKDSSLGAHKLELVLNRATFDLSPDTFNSNEAPFPGSSAGATQASVRWLATGAVISTFGNFTNEARYGRQWGPSGFLRVNQPDTPFFIDFASVTDFDNRFLSQGRETTVKQFIDNVAWTKGQHLVRFGADYQEVFADTFNDAGIHPTISLGSNSANSTGITASDFTSLPSGATGTAIVNRAANVFADVTGFLGSASQTFNVTTPSSGYVAGATRARLFKQRDLGLYVQDQWRARPNLTLNYGLRWDYQGVPTIPNGLAIQVTNVDDIFGISGPGNLFNPNAPAGAAPAKATLDFVSGDTGRGLYNNDWNNFAPSLGFAYSPNFRGGFLSKLFGAEGSSSIRAGYSISYTREGFTVISNALGTGTTNPGLIGTAANNQPTGVLSAAGVGLPTPSFRIPITDRENFLANQNNSLWAVDPDLRIPYVQQWSFGFEREIARDTAFEVRYVGNRMVKGWRANNYNEVNIFENGFLREFVNAQNNYNIFLAANPRCGQTGQPACTFANTGLPGQVNLPVFTAFFTGVAATSAFTNATFISNLTQNNVGALASTLAFSTTYRANRENPARGIPANFFVANPNANGITLLGNDATSNYHALQMEVRRRFSRGLQFQADYTFSKALTNARGTFASQTDLSSFRTLRDKGLDYARSDFDQTHRFVANGLYELPFGHGRQFLSNAGGLVDRVIGGWTLGTIVTWQTRPPFYITSNRSTVNQFNAANNPADLVGMSFEEFKRNLGVFRTPTGVYFINPAILDITTNASGQFVSSQLKSGLMAAPAPGSFGNFPINSLNGPRFFNIDASLVKRIPITEGVRGELKTTVINLLNNPNFIYNGNDFDSTNFGRITAQSGSPRVVHFTLRLSW